MRRTTEDGNVCWIVVMDTALGPLLVDGEVEVATSVDHLTVIHITIGVIVADDRPSEAPFVTENGGDEVIITASPTGTDTVEGGHKTKGLTFFDREFEWFEVDFTDRLLFAVGIDTVGATVGFLVVEGEVFDVGVDALLLSGFDDVSGHLTGDEWVFAVVFGVTSAEWRTVHVDAWRIPAGIWKVGLGWEAGFFVTEQAFVADGVALLLGKLDVPGLGDEDFRAIVASTVDFWVAREGDSAGWAVAADGLWNAIA